MRVLVVEDSLSLRRSIAEALRHHRYSVDTVGDGGSALRSVEETPYDLIILDLMIPAIDGFSVLTRLRRQNNQTPVLVLTAKDTVADRVNGLRAGADDYLTKPFAFEELLARVETVIRRSHVVRTTVIRIGEVEINLARRCVTRNGREVTLARREFALLEFLVLHRNEVVTRQAIEAHIYDSLVEPMSNVVDAAIYALRRVIDKPGAASMIETRRGVGYILREQQP
jgi:DNA-binding response OmpR family regulator